MNSPPASAPEPISSPSTTSTISRSTSYSSTVASDDPDHPISDSDGTSDEQPDLGAFTTVFRAWGHLQPQPRVAIPSTSSSASSAGPLSPADGRQSREPWGTEPDLGEDQSVSSFTHPHLSTVSVSSPTEEPAEQPPYMDTVWDNRPLWQSYLNQTSAPADLSQQQRQSPSEEFTEILDSLAQERPRSVSVSRTVEIADFSDPERAVASETQSEVPSGVQDDRSIAYPAHDPYSPSPSTSYSDGPAPHPNSYLPGIGPHDQGLSVPVFSPNSETEGASLEDDGRADGNDSSQPTLTVRQNFPFREASTRDGKSLSGTDSMMTTTAPISYALPPSTSNPYPVSSFARDGDGTETYSTITTTGPISYALPPSTSNPYPVDDLSSSMSRDMSQTRSHDRASVQSFTSTSSDRRQTHSRSSRSDSYTNESLIESRPVSIQTQPNFTSPVSLSTSTTSRSTEDSEISNLASNASTRQNGSSSASPSSQPQPQPPRSVPPVRSGLSTLISADSQRPPPMPHSLAETYIAPTYPYVTTLNQHGSMPSILQEAEDPPSPLPSPVGSETFPSDEDAWDMRTPTKRGDAVQEHAGGGHSQRTQSHSQPRSHALLGLHALPTLTKPLASHTQQLQSQLATYPPSLPPVIETHAGRRSDTLGHVGTPRAPDIYTHPADSTYWTHGQRMALTPAQWRQKWDEEVREPGVQSHNSNSEVHGPSRVETTATRVTATATSDSSDLPPNRSSVQHSTDQEEHHHSDRHESTSGSGDAGRGSDYPTLGLLDEALSFIAAERARFESEGAGRKRLDVLHGTSTNTTTTTATAITVIAEHGLGVEEGSGLGLGADERDPGETKHRKRKRKKGTPTTTTGGGTSTGEGEDKGLDIDKEKEKEKEKAKAKAKMGTRPLLLPVDAKENDDTEDTAERTPKATSSSTRKRTDKVPVTPVKQITILARPKGASSSISTATASGVISSLTSETMKRPDGLNDHDESQVAATTTTTINLVGTKGKRVGRRERQREKDRQDALRAQQAQVEGGVGGVGVVEEDLGVFDFSTSSANELAADEVPPKTTDGAGSKTPRARKRARVDAGVGANEEFGGHGGEELEGEVAKGEEGVTVKVSKSAKKKQRSAADAPLSSSSTGKRANKPLVHAKSYPNLQDPSLSSRSTGPSVSFSLGTIAAKSCGKAYEFEDAEQDSRSNNIEREEEDAKFTAGSRQEKRTRLITLATKLLGSFPEQKKDIRNVLKRLEGGGGGGGIHHPINSLILPPPSTQQRGMPDNTLQSSKKKGHSRGGSKGGGAATAAAATSQGAQGIASTNVNGDEEVQDPAEFDIQGPPQAGGGGLVHIFIDHSNILIGLLNFLKRHPPPRSVLEEYHHGVPSTCCTTGAVAAMIPPPTPRRPTVKDPPSTTTTTTSSDVALAASTSTSSRSVNSKLTGINTNKLNVLPIVEPASPEVVTATAGKSAVGGERFKFTIPLPSFATANHADQLTSSSSVGSQGDAGSSLLLQRNHPSEAPRGVTPLAKQKLSQSKSEILLSKSVPASASTATLHEHMATKGKGRARRRKRIEGGGVQSDGDGGGGEEEEEGDSKNEGGGSSGKEVVSVGKNGTAAAASAASTTKKFPKHLWHAALALILERGRGVSRRVVVTSSPLYQPMDKIQALGYEVRVYIRVPDHGDGMDRREKEAKYGGNALGKTIAGKAAAASSAAAAASPPTGANRHAWPRPVPSNTSTESAAIISQSMSPPKSTAATAAAAAARSSSNLPLNAAAVAATAAAGPNTSTTTRVRYREQGVDELLQLKLHQAIAEIDGKPPKGSTIVLATGDGNVGQFSEDGFIGPVRTALKRGWRVEVVAWEDGLSKVWRREFGENSEWGQKGLFRVIPLEPFATSLVEAAGW